VEVADRRAGGDRVSRRTGLLLAYLAVLVLACACVVGGVAVARERDDRQRTDDLVANAERYGEVMKAAEATALAMTNVDYRAPEESTEAVKATATGTFLDQYEAASSTLSDLAGTFKATLESEASATAVSSLDADSAVVLVATEGTVTNNETGAEPSARYFRFLIELVRVDDRWLANELEIVG
jgi:Mce-associated membrane protein